jgi:ribosome biogenesis GTPase A
VGKKRGCLIKGGEVDLTKAAGILLNELRAGQIGRISLQKPPAPKAA